MKHWTDLRESDPKDAAPNSTGSFSKGLVIALPITLVLWGIVAWLV